MMNYKSPPPSGEHSKNFNDLLEYVDGLKEETEAKLNFIENTLQKIKASLKEVKEAIK